MNLAYKILDVKEDTPGGWKLRLGFGALVLILGTALGMFVEDALGRTKWFGPTLDEVSEHQNENFDQIKHTLDELARNTDPAERKRLQEELARLLTEQEKLTERTHAELLTYRGELEKSRQELLDKHGVATGGADFWLDVGESATVGAKGSVVGLVYKNNTQAGVNYDGKRLRLDPGDSFDITAPGAPGKVVFRQIKDGRAGFDFVAS